MLGLNLLKEGSWLPVRSSRYDIPLPIAFDVAVIVSDWLILCWIRFMSKLQDCLWKHCYTAGVCLQFIFIFSSIMNCPPTLKLGSVIGFFLCIFLKILFLNVVLNCFVNSYSIKQAHDDYQYINLFCSVLLQTKIKIPNIYIHTH